jgi:hypothetical protein
MKLIYMFMLPFALGMEPAEAEPEADGELMNRLSSSNCSGAPLPGQGYCAGLEAVVYHGWTVSRSIVSGIFTVGHSIHPRNPAERPIGYWSGLDSEGGQRYYLENAETLKPSLGHKIGFRAIDTSTVGIRAPTRQRGSSLKLDDNDASLTLTTGNGALSLRFDPAGAITGTRLGPPTAPFHSTARGGVGLRAFPAENIAVFDKGVASYIHSDPNDKVQVSGVMTPLGFSNPVGLSASFTAGADYIRIDGQIAQNSSAPDKAVLLQVGIPLVAANWTLWLDPVTKFPMTPAGGGPVWQGLQSEPKPGMPATNTVHESCKVLPCLGTGDIYPMLVLTSPDETQGVMLAMPMEPTAYMYSTAWDADSNMLIISFNFGLSNRSLEFPNTATFSALLFPLAEPEWGFRGALEQFYSHYPAIWKENVIRDQGLWLFFTSDDLVGPSIPKKPEDFGFRFGEMGDNGFSPARVQALEQLDMLYFPYIEPLLRHYPVPAGDWRNQAKFKQLVNACAGNTSCPYNDLASAIIRSVVENINGDWVYGMTVGGANPSALLFMNVEPKTLADPLSQASWNIKRAKKYETLAVLSNVTLGGQ